MDNFFQSLQGKSRSSSRESNMEAEIQRTWLRKQYIHFCQSMLTSTEELEEDLEKLIRMPEITDISFTQKGGGLSMLLATTNVFIVDPRSGLTHDIGEFVIIINRHNKSVQFINVTRTVKRPSDAFEVFHPHIPAETKKICIQSGLELLIEHIGNGRMYDATRILVQALFKTNGTPYCPVVNWPVRKE